MKTTPMAALAIVATLAAGCGVTPGATPSTRVTAPAPPTLRSTPSPVVKASGTSPCIAGPGDEYVLVDAQANIFGAGHSAPPAPGGGGAGVLPPFVGLQLGRNSVITFPCVAGRIDWGFGSVNTSANGSTEYSTNIQSFNGVSGIVHNKRGVFLVGLFLTDEKPRDPAPERLDFSETCPDACTVDRLDPGIGQTFFVGLGGDEPEYAVPTGATRLFLGLADAQFTRGAPGWYGNNRGNFEVVVRLP
jgi:hypothetical protein